MKLVEGHPSDHGFRVAVLQITARRDYEIARSLYRYGALAGMATDLYLPNWARPFGKGRLGRYAISELPPEKVYGAPLVGLLYRAAMWIMGPFSAAPHIWATKALTGATIARLKRAKPNVVFGLDTGALELFRSFDTVSPRPKLVLEQCVAPRASQYRMLERLSDAMPSEMVRKRKANVLKLKVREEEEWRLADLVISPSDYVTEELVKAGCPAAKIHFVPYGYTPKTPARKRDYALRTMPLRVLFVGAIDYRKGVHDLAVVAERLGDRVKVEALGKIVVDKKTAARLGKSIRLMGPQSFGVVQSAYQNADVLILPSYLEGSAMVVYEAMSFGLPCLVTRQTGAIVTDAVDGFVVEAGDIDAIQGIFEQILADPGKLQDVSERSVEAAGRVSAELYGDRLIRAIAS
ncbi:glycosyltransferase family 4 protein [Mesorhizobium sp. M1006]|uniref:glycosyltransferase family 4 protein n=1 Tax=Mesorhizobium sp. M1006 TaxID=2957048 RepID=UPI00333C91DF